MTTSNNETNSEITIKYSGVHSVWNGLGIMKDR